MSLQLQIRDANPSPSPLYPSVTVNSYNPLSGCRPPFRSELRRKWTQVSHLRDTTLPSSSLHLLPGQALPLSLSLPS